MVYKFGEVTKRRYHKLKPLSFSILIILGFGLLLTSKTISSAASPIISARYQSISSSNKHKTSDKIKLLKVGGSSHSGDSGGSNTINTNLVTPNPLLQTASCNLSTTSIPGLANAQSPELQKLAQYDNLCDGPIVARDSFFVPTPITIAEAQSEASDVATTLKEYAKYNVKPLVFIEPDTDNGTNIDLDLYAAGSYDTSLDAYFSALKTDGVTDSMMGMWVILPEGNLPVWTTVDPAIYEKVVIKTIQLQKKYFPTSQSSLMLDSETYPVGAGWGDGTYVSLLQYVKDIPKGLVDSFGLQGFPWAAPANQTSNNVYDPKTYLRIDFAAQAASSLGINNIWFNTGTFNQMYTQNATQTVTASPQQRQTMLNGVITQAKALQAQGFSVDIHLFAQDKSNVSEATDWSYWKVQPGNDANTAVFTSFAQDATISGIPLWLFDTYGN